MYVSKLKSICEVIGWFGIVINSALSVLCIYVLVIDDQEGLDGFIILLISSFFLVIIIYNLISSMLVVLTTKNNNRYLLLPWILTTIVDVILIVVAAAVFKVFYSLIALPFLIIPQIFIVKYYGELLLNK